MKLTFFVFCIAVGCAQGTKPLGEFVYVSKTRGQANNDSCGTKSLPCKSLQVGIDKLPRGGKLFVDGENAKVDPYKCESSAGKLVVDKNISIQSYTAPAHIYCLNGIFLLADGPTGMNISMIGVQLKNTVLHMKNVNATIQNCIFLESSPAIDVRNSQGLPLYSLNIMDSMFIRNHRCIDLMQTDSNHKIGCSRLILKLRNVLFQENTALRDDAKGGLVFVNHKNCLCKDVSFLSTWDNITTTTNRGKITKHEDNGQRIRKRVQTVIKENPKKPLNGKSTKCDPILDSLVVVYTCSAKITLNQVTSDYNSDMRFLGLRSCHSDVRIYSCDFHRHIIDSPGGVIYIPVGYSTSVVIKNSDFSRNSGSIGGVLQIDGGSKKTAILNLFNVSFLYCSGKTTGCAVSIGSVEKRGVDKVFATLDGVLFNRCHNKIKRGKGRNNHGPLCLRATMVTSVNIHNSTFFRNKNKKTAAVNIKHSPTTNRGSVVKVQILRTIFYQNACDTTKPTLGIFIEKPTQVRRSQLTILHSAFVRNRGTVISVDNFQDIKLINITCSYSKGLCYEFYIGKCKALKHTPPGLDASFQMQNSTFSNNYQSFNIKYVQP
ncbi:uncharacterized protein LOC116294273, partial [Actinia tenebrosa]|uniref:Uncharacterized protein LOC116294273 n=1 Tax=Actinia tenebrosa TaxID=6105 RepID=A0A6P8HMU8_ACTTE